MRLLINVVEYMRNTYCLFGRDYRGLKKRITAIRKAQQGLSFYVSSSDSPDEPPSPPDAPQASIVDSEEFERSIDLALERVASQGKDSGRGDAPSERGNPVSIVSGRRRGSLGISSFKAVRGKRFSSMSAFLSIIALLLNWR